MGVVDIALGRERTSSEQNCVKAFKVFSCDVVKYLKVSIKVFSVAALYIKRAEPHLAFDDDEKDKAPERVFLGAMMLASKVRSLFILENRNALITFLTVRRRYYISCRILGGGQLLYQRPKAGQSGV